jgi:dTDP-4-dehydrorhamnose reductase
MRIAITGAAGLFGHALVEAFSSRHTVFPMTRAEADITDAESVRAALGRMRPDVVVHPAGIPDLDIADADPAQAHLVNVQGTRHVAESAHAVGAGVVYISTDAVFNGQNTRPYVESDPPCPITVYGRTKLDGEAVVQTLPEHWIFRVPVLFGPGKTNFVEKGLRKIVSGEQYFVASD